MAKPRVTLDHAGIAAILKSGPMAEAVHAAAEQIAEKARGIMVEGLPGDVPLPVEVTDYVTDRAKSTVVLAHPSGLAVQAKHGVLTGGAAGAGFEVTG